MTRTAKLSTALATIALATMALAGCTTAAAPEATEQTPKASPAAVATESESSPTVTPKDTRAPTPNGPETCGSNFADFVSYDDNLSWQFSKPLKDLGARDFAAGDVTYHDDGTPLTYTVEPGDVEAVIGERFCAGGSLGSMNHVHDIYPGQVLWLNPNPDIPWIDFYSPPDAEAGFEQSPYQEAITAAGAAVDAGDIDTVRAIWNNTLSAMFTDQDIINSIQKVVDTGDPDALRQLFS